MIWRPRAFAGKLARDTRGGAMVEAALGLPVLLTAMIGVFEIAYFFFVASSIENAVLRASRFGVTGAAGTDVTREDAVRAVIKQQTFGTVDMDTVVIETLVYEQFSDIGMPEPFDDANGNEVYDEGEDFSDVNGNSVWDEDMAIAGLGSAGDIVLYRISYEAKGLTGYMNWAHKALNISSTVAVRNEPY